MGDKIESISKVTALKAPSILGILFLFVIVACEETFSPSAPFRPRLVVYSILSTESDTQYVRLYTTYSPPNDDPIQNPDERPVTDAQVIIADGVVNYTFRDTVIPRADTSRYRSDVRLYYCYPMKPQSGKTYALTCISPAYGQITATARIPDAAVLNIPATATYVLDNPATNLGKGAGVSFELSSLTAAYLVRFHIVFTAEDPWESEDRRQKEKVYQVPLKRKPIDRLYERCQITFPQVTPRKTPHVTASPVRGEKTLSYFEFPFPAYNESIEQIQRAHFDVKFRRAVFYLIQFDDALYKYYATANPFEDRYSVRLDQPVFTNINGGLGVFGGTRVDSIAWSLPERIKPFPDPYPIPPFPPITYCRE